MLQIHVQITALGGGLCGPPGVFLLVQILRVQPGAGGLADHWRPWRTAALATHWRTTGGPLATLADRGCQAPCVSTGGPWRPLADLATLATTGGLVDWRTRGGLDTCMLPRTTVVPLL